MAAGGSASNSINIYPSEWRCLPSGIGSRVTVVGENPAAHL